MDKEKVTEIKKFFSEIQMLKRIMHTGARLAGVNEPDSVAEHALVSAQIAFVLAELEGADPYRAAVINLFHDNPECRIGDHHKVSSRYLDTKGAEELAAQEQLDNLPASAKQKILALYKEKEERQTKEGIVAQDADWLEIAVQAKIYLETGYKGCQNWLDNVEAALESESAKAIFASIKSDPDFLNCWWQGLKKMTYTKLEKN